MIVKSRSILYALLFLLWFPAHDVWSPIPYGAQIRLIVRLIISCCILITYSPRLIRMRKDSFNFAFILLLAYFVILTVSTIENKLGMIYTVEAVELGLFVFSMIAWFQFKEPDLLRDFFDAAYFMSWVYLFGSLASDAIFLLTNASAGYQGTNFFIGSRAETVQLEVLLCVLVTIRNKMHGRFKDKTTLSFIILCFLNALMLSSGQGTMMLGLLIIGWLIGKGRFKRFFSGLSPIKSTCYLAILYWLVLGGIYQTIDAFVYLIEKVLNKSITLTGRTYIFEKSFVLISNSPIWGYGYKNSAVTDYIGDVNTAFVSAHNSILDVALNSGIPSCIILCFLSILVLFRIYKCLDENGNGGFEVCVMIYVSVLVYYLGGLVNLAIESVSFYCTIALSFGIMNIKQLYDGET